MSLHGTLMESLLTWVNSLKVDEPIVQLSQMQDLNIFIKIVTKLNGNVDDAARILEQPLEDRLKFLQRHCRCGSRAEDLVQWQKILLGENSELEICKVIVLLFYVSNMKCKNSQEWETFDHKTQTELASILRFVLDNEDDPSLDDRLISFLQRKAARVISSSDSASSSDETMSPNLPARKTQVRFLELHRIASSSTLKSLPLDSPSSPISEVLHMPQFQIRRLRKQLIEGRDLRDELELELSETKKRMAEKEAQIFLMQQRIERLVVLSEKQADQQEPQEMKELREKNESLMIRLRDALKQCQDMKTDRNQLERKNDQLSDENGDLSYKVRDLSSRLAQLQDALNETSEEHEASVAAWQKQQSQLENELNAAITEKKSLEERNQILQEKISMLEDQLKMLRDSESHDKGERLGDVLKLEHLQQEVVALNAKSSELQARITHVEEEKMAAKADLESQRSRFETEKLQLQDIVTNLQTSLSEITFQKEKQDQDARLQEEKLTCQITTLKLEISKLKTSLVQKDQELSGLHKEVEEERRRRGQVEIVLQKQEESSKKSIAELNHQVDHLGSTLRQTEAKLLELNEQLGLNTQQVLSLQQERDKFVGERDSAITMFNEYKNTKEEEVNALGKTYQALQNDNTAGLVAMEEVKKEKAELTLKVQELDATILDLIAKCQALDAENDNQSKSHTATLELLKTQISEQETQLRMYEESVSGMELISEENAKIKEQLLSLEQTVENLKELLENEKKTSAILQSERQKSSELEGDVKILQESRDQAVNELCKEKSAVKTLESKVAQLEEELGAKTENLQQKLHESSSAVRQREEEIDKLQKEMCTWKERAETSSQVEADIERLKKDHDEVCKQLTNERLKVSEMEAEAKAAMSAQLDQVRHLESELSSAKAQLKEREVQEQKMLHTIQSTEEKLHSAQREEAEHVSQLERTCSNKVRELEVLSKELSDEKHKTVNLEAALKCLEEQKSEKILTLESKINSMHGTVKEGEHAVQKLSEELEQMSKQLKESQVKHQQELAEKEEVGRCLAREKEKVLGDLKIEREAKLEAEAQLQKYMDVHKNEFSALQNELSRSLDLITMKESELDRLTKEIASKEEKIRKEKDNAASLVKEVEALKALKEHSTSQEEQIKHHIQTIKATDSEMSALKATLSERDRQVERLEQDLESKIREGASVQQQYQDTLGEVQALQSRTAELESRCSGLEDAVSVARKEASDAKTAASEKASASEQHQKGMQTLAAEVQQERHKMSELVKQLEESQALQSETDASLEALKKELYHKVQELEQSQKSLSESSRELTCVKSTSQEYEKELSGTKEQVAQHQKEIEKKAEEIQSLQKEVNNLATKLASNESSCVEAKELLAKEAGKSHGLEKQLRTVQEKFETSTKELLEKQGIIQNLTAEAASYKEAAEKQRMTVEELQKTLSSYQVTTEKLEKDVKVWQEKCSQKEDGMSTIQRQLEELSSVRNLYQEIKAEQTLRESQHKEELLQNQKTAESLQVELEKIKAEAASVASLRGTLVQKEKMLETLQKEMKDHLNQMASLQEEKKHLAGENKTLSQSYEQELKKMQAELATMSEKHTQELESLRLQCEKKVSEGKEQMQDLTSKYEHAKTKILDERQKFQEEKQKLLTQVDQLEAAKKEQSDQVRELNKQINQQEKTIRSQQQKLKQDGETHDEVEKTRKKVSELEEQLEKQVQAVEHYKTQMDKAKVHYDAKKQQNQQLSDELASITREQDKLRKESSDLKVQSERLHKELQLSLLQTKEAEENCKTLSGQVRSLQAQVEYADRQLRELGKFQVSTDAMKSRETLRLPRVTRSRADVSIDSLDMSDEEEHPMNSTRKNGRSHQGASTSTAKSVSPEPQSSNRLPRKVESLESLYFTPIPNRAQSKLDSSIGSIGDLSLDSTKKTRSARRRTTQVINITMTKRTQEEVEPEPESANTSFYSLRSAPSQQNLQQPNKTRRGGKPQPAFSAPALTSLPSLESLVKTEHTSSDDSLNNSVLMSLPGYRPTTRSSARLSQTGGRNSFYLSTCQDEPDPQEDWTRIAEMQQRNRACPPHLKTCYPVESRPSVLASTITDEEVKTGDPKETMRRATLLPSQIQESMGSTRRMTLGSSGGEHSWGGSGITTRQQMKRVSEETHYGPDTPESKKSASCFPRPNTPKDKPESRRLSVADRKPNISQQSSTSRRQSMAFSILNTPKKLGSSLLKRGLNKKSTPKSTPQGRGSTSKSPNLGIRKSPSRKSPRAAAKSPKTNKFFERSQKRNK
ncbi:nuclear mitotic apparatus protein 1 isoform X1 [Bufo gargarizans]|uniref:nuclear mitotic apparatus protein 1 isoform X1 n=1 Tax=Bufo gargarizans TaxID=30331 RepID=UPI001CF4B151|nr:nuclear mitotic apparatus protein 1 isoform X1 [Bufo gargarizans]XP_044142658.1 nuclear mitotic apparatus protein 1 isoform X1 [Bufo gargarizans]